MLSNDDGAPVVITRHYNMDEQGVVHAYCKISSISSKMKIVYFFYVTLIFFKIQYRFFFCKKYKRNIVSTDVHSEQKQETLVRSYKIFPAAATGLC